MAASNRLMQQRISVVEEQFGDLCVALASYGRNVAKLRDKGDQVARTLLVCAQTDSYGQNTQLALRKFAEHLSAVQDHRNAQVLRLEGKVVHPLKDCGSACRRAKTDIQRVTRASRQTTSQKAELEVNKFESNKLHDIQKVLSEFLNIEMIFHAKAIELYTQCHHSLSLLSQNDDLQTQEIDNSVKMRRADRAATTAGLRSTDHASSSRLRTTESAPSVVTRDVKSATGPRTTLSATGPPTMLSATGPRTTLSATGPPTMLSTTGTSHLSSGTHLSSDYTVTDDVDMDEEEDDDELDSVDDDDDDDETSRIN